MSFPLAVLHLLQEDKASFPGVLTVVFRPISHEASFRELFATSQSLAPVTRLMALALVWEVGEGKLLDLDKLFTSVLTHKLLKDWFLRGRNVSHWS